MNGFDASPTRATARSDRSRAPIEEVCRHRRLVPGAGRRRLGLKALALVPATAAVGATATMGNATIDRPLLDTYSNFIVVDRSNPADADGLLNEVEYYASTFLDQGAIAFALVRGEQTSGFKVIWISENIAKPAASGVFSYLPPTPIPLKAGDNLAIYSEKHGLVPYSLLFGEPGSQTELWEPNGSGKPVVGETLNIEYPPGSPRNYSVQGLTTDCTFSVATDRQRRLQRLQAPRRHPGEARLQLR